MTSFAGGQTSGHTKIGVCPLCGEDIYTNQRTAYRALAGATVRIHAYHLAEHPSMGYADRVPPGHAKGAT